ncbi:alpha-amylase family glycosyl hydrolase [Metabacillus fastidiosus]|uniref:alpha-amylase family glycosyl hydrolase n=1 Tax=Metabacillus fastidiosus TaxID=1458 RepID=UPI002DB59470|nr:alpha-amylase family glycosyl hydrolase [Metabacillus fastidiosus]MEC2077535.1 alpha-amylase family glycosyl hydrolase [Metabacillus fastidiosus]
MSKRLSQLLLIPFLLFYASQVSAAEKEEQYIEDEIIYSLMVDRFNNGDTSNDGDGINYNDPKGYHGGDIEGIIRKLDYIQTMGFTAISLSPIFESDSFDGSSVHDLKKVDKHFGTIDDIKRLVSEAHTRDMKIILQFITNNKDEQYIIETAKWWIEQTDIDGYYLKDTEKFSSQFWSKFSKEMKTLKRNFILIGDAERENSGNDLFLNDSFYKEASNVFSKPNQSIKSLLDQEIDSLSATFIDNEDEIRFTRKAIENKFHPGPRIRMALAYMYTAPGVPIIYYGTEIALDGGEAPDNLKMMDFQTGEELIQYIEKLAKVRHSLPVLAKGNIELLYEKNGMAIYKRTYRKESVIVALNNTTETQKVMISNEEIAENKELRGLLTGDIFHEENGYYEFILDRELAEVYEIKEQTGPNWPLISVFILVPGLFLLFLIIAKRRGTVR